MKIEISSQRNRFTEAEIRAMVKESKAFWASPAGIKRQAELDREKRNYKAAPPKFPELAQRAKAGSTRPALADNRAARVRLLEKQAAKLPPAPVYEHQFSAPRNRNR